MPKSPFSIHKHDAGVKRGVGHSVAAPGPKSHPLLGDLLEIRRDRLRFLGNLTHQYGDVVRFRMGPQTLHLVNHPDHINHVLSDNSPNYVKGIGLAHAKSLLGDGLLTSEGSYWRNQRRLIQTLFHREWIKEYAAAMAGATTSMLDNWETLAEHEQPVNVYDEMTRLSFCILTKTLFNVDIANKSDAVGSALTVALQHAIHRMTRLFALPDSIPTPGNLRFRKALRSLDTLIYSLIAERRRTRIESHDLLSIFLFASNGDSGNPMSDKQIRDQLMTILLAGHETTAIALTWTWYLLSQDQHVEEQLRLELSRALSGRPPQFEDLPKLKYGKAIIEEAMRLYPPVWVIPRKATGQDVIGGYHIPANSGVLISPYTMHRHPDFWQDPGCFDPERFTGHRAADRPQYSYLPFGAGPRNCVGGTFGMTEAQMIVSMVAQRYRLHLLPRQDVELEPLLTLRPKHGILMTLQKVASYEHSDSVRVTSGQAQETYPSMKERGVIAR